MPKLAPLESSARALEESWLELGGAGTWWTGAERVAMAAEARAARGCGLCAGRKAALSPWAMPAGHEASAVLAAPVVDAVHRLASDPGRIRERWLADLVAAGLEPEAVVELVAVVSFLSLADTFAVATGDAERPLPRASDGEPSRARPPGLEQSCAWVPTVDPARAEGTTKLVYGMIQADAGFVFHVARALTSVPAAMQTFFRAFAANYHTHGATKGSLSRPQVELLAASTSSINECFY
jgi:hypothetical protein